MGFDRHEESKNIRLQRLGTGDGRESNLEFLQLGDTWWYIYL